MSFTELVWVVVGAGNGGKTAAADIAIQGGRVRLFEFPTWAVNLDPVLANQNTITAVGAVEGTARLELVTSDIAEAMDGADVIMFCGQANSQELAADALSQSIKKHQLVVLNPGSTGGSLVFLRKFRENDVPDDQVPVVVEFGTLTYGTRAKGATVDCTVKVQLCPMGCIPTSNMDEALAKIRPYFPGVKAVPSRSVLEAGLCNANPVIHPAITLCNLSPMETRGSAWLFYKDGCSPLVANLIRSVDLERLAIMNALGYEEAVTDARLSCLQGYATSDDPDNSYYEVYSQGAGFVQFRCPPTLDHCRYFHEDVGMGLVLYCSLGRLLGVPTPVSEAIIAFASAVQQVDYAAQQARTLGTLGLDGMSIAEMKNYVETGRRAKAT
eukprot:TRINITY_DN12464_c0_g1_i1.p1 TRINITY_DN12464_c0_g1~~TRINITY_DN12464_c0_g1_i1.p1  ORF type:complete len:383 (+),score=87.59 TRINITY_DN12464_c0_g1_i1:48-1196(+)